MLEQNDIIRKIQKIFNKTNEKEVLLTLLLLEEEKNFKNITTKRYPIDKPVERATKKSIRSFMRHCLHPVDFRHLVPGTSVKELLKCVDNEGGTYINGFVRGMDQGFPCYRNVEEHERRCFVYFSKMYSILIKGLYPDASYDVNGTILVDLSIVEPDLGIVQPLVPAYDKKRGDIYLIKSYGSHVTAVIDNIDPSIINELQLHPQFIVDFLKTRSAGKVDGAETSYVITHLKQAVAEDEFLSEPTKQLVHKIDAI